MAIPTINFAGYVYNDAGTAVSGASVNLYAKNTTTTSLASDTTDSNGRWDINYTTAGTSGLDIQIQSGESYRRIKYQDKIHLEEVDTALLNIRGVEGAAAAMYFFADEGEDAGDRWNISVADAGVMTMGNDLNSQGTYVAHVTITPNATVANSTFAVAGHLDVDGTANLDAVDIDGAVQLDSTFTIGVDGTGYQVKFFGESAGAFMLYDDTNDQLEIRGPSADATTSTGKLLLSTALTDINANDVIGKIDFQAPLETGTDAVKVSASIQAIAQGTFAANVNATDLLFYTGHDNDAAERFRFTSQGEIGVGGANYGTDGQVLTSGGAGAAPAWEDAGGGGGTMTVVAKEALAAGAPVALVNDGGTVKATNIQGMGNDLSDPTDDNNIYGLEGRWYASSSLVSCGSEGLAFVWTSAASDTLTNYYPFVTIGTYSTTTRQIEWAAPTAVASASAYPTRAVWDSNTERLLVVYSNSGAVSKGIVYAISSGNVVTTGGTAPGTAASVNIQTHGEISFDLVFDDTANTVHMAAEDGADSDFLKMTMLTITGGTTNTVAITIAKAKVNDADITAGGLSLRWGNARACLAYMDAGDSNYTKASS